MKDHEPASGSRYEAKQKVVSNTRIPIELEFTGWLLVRSGRELMELGSLATDPFIDGSTPWFDHGP